MQLWKWIVEFVTASASMLATIQLWSRGWGDPHRLNLTEESIPRTFLGLDRRLACAAATLAILPLGGCAAGTSDDAADAQGGETIVGASKGDGVPTVAIVSPNDGRIFLVGKTVAIIVQVSDHHDSANEMRLLVTDSANTTEPVYDGMGKNSGNPIGWITMTAGGHTITATVTDTSGQTATTSVTIYGKTAPGAPTVGILPDPATTLDPLFAKIIHDSKDPDGIPGDLTYDYVWLRNGEATPYVGATVPAGAAHKMELWKVVVTPHSGGIDGVVGEALLAISDAAPSTPTVAVVPETVDLASVVSCTLAAAATDADGDALTYGYFWIVDGYVNPLPTGQTVAVAELHRDANGGLVKAGSQLKCRAVASDCQQSGLPGDSTAVTVQSVDSCAGPMNPCAEHATCTNTDTAQPTCTCDPGWTGTGNVMCYDFNECVEGNGGCNAYAFCTNTPGSFTCTCKTGFTGDGKTTCDDIDECATDNGGCDVHASCTNTVGGFTCACIPPWTGTGMTCAL